jgi:hypothetical protein
MVLNIFKERRREVETTLFLGKAWSLYLILVGGALLLNGKEILRAAEEILNTQAHMIISGVIALIIGILMVLSHNIWVFGWPVIITLIGWLSLIKGITYLYLGQTSVKWVYRYLQVKAITVIGGISLALGVVLAFFAFS